MPRVPWSSLNGFRDLVASYMEQDFDASYMEQDVYAYCPEQDSAG